MLCSLGTWELGLEELCAPESSPPGRYQLGRFWAPVQKRRDRNLSSAFEDRLWRDFRERKAPPQNCVRAA